MGSTATGLPRRLVAEALGTALLVAIVIGSGIMGERLAGGNLAVALLGNTLATGAGLIVLILVFGPISGAQLNPAVTLYSALCGEMTWRIAGAYAMAQIAGGLIGTAIAHVMFERPMVEISLHGRTGLGQWVGELVATLALLLAIVGCRRATPAATPYAVGLVITAGYWFTSSTSFANPAVTIARAFTDSFAGIRPQDAPAFIAAQLVATLAAAMIFRWLFAAVDPVEA
jgi:glycerol uptake facilitator-like aquaporin